MANLRADLLNRVGNEKYYNELELVRLAQDPNMNYKEKVEQIGFVLEGIALLDAQLTLVERYFQEPVAVPQAVQVPEGRVANGQSHGE